MQHYGLIAGLLLPIFRVSQLIVRVEALLSSVNKQPVIMAANESLTPKIPAFLYGTAWKKEKTTQLVYEALNSGFVGIDTAAQPKNYREDLCGEALRAFQYSCKVEREKVFVSRNFLCSIGPAS